MAFKFVYGVATPSWDGVVRAQSGWIRWPVVFVAAAVPLAGVGYALYLYFSWVGSEQRTVTIAFVGGLLVKTFLIPFVKGIVTSSAFKVLMGWLRGSKRTKSA